MNTGTRNGGFGPWFGLQFVLGVVAFIWAEAASSAGARRQPAVRVPMAIVAWTLIISAAFPEAWWARYVPLVWIAPLLLVYTISEAQLKHPGLMALALAVLLTGAANTGLAMVDSLYNGVVLTNRAHAAVDRLHDKGRPVILVPLSGNGTRDVWKHRLDKAGIPWRVVREKDCPDQTRVSAYMALCETPL